MKYIVCYSGGHSSALAAVESVRRYKKENVVLLNHDISEEVEHEDIKRFKIEVANYLGLKITYANSPERITPIGVAEKMSAFQYAPGRALCTKYLKTDPFNKWLEENCKDKSEFTIVYGFDADETDRISRRRIIMRSMGFKTEFPLAEKHEITEIEQLGIERPKTYKVFKHANCIGCLKAGRQHWYVVYCLRKDIFNKALELEEKLGHSIIKGIYLKDLIPIYEDIISKGICPNDKENSATFWARVENTLPEQMSLLPCDCTF